MKAFDCDITIEIGQYREFEKGALKGFFTLIIHPFDIKIIDCRYFVSGDRRWFTFPQKEFQKKGEEKTNYVPYLSILNNDIKQKVEDQVLKALLNPPKDNINAKPSNSSIQKQETNVSGQSSALPF